MSAVDIRESFARILEEYGKQSIRPEDVPVIFKKIRDELGINNTTKVINPYTNKQVTLKAVGANLQKKIKKGISSPSQLLNLIVTPPHSEDEEEGLGAKVEEEDEPSAEEEEEPKFLGTRNPQATKHQPAPREVPSLIKPPEEEEEYTIQRLKRDLIRKTTGAKYLGSGTPLLKYLKTGERPDSEADLIALEHDIRYTTATSQEEVNKADALFISRMSDLAVNMPTLGQTILSTIAGTAITLKTFIDKIPGVRTEGVFVDFEKNKLRPERDVLLGIQDMLEEESTLTAENTEFIFDDETTRMLEHHLKQSDETPKEEGKSKVEEPIPSPKVEQPVSLPSRTPVPSLSPIPREFLGTRNPQKHPDLRKGHIQRVTQEQILQQLKQEEEERKMALVYKNDPDDYMAKPTPNSYMRPMFATEWLDIAKLQQYQTPEYVKAEKEIWKRNWQTPFQFGEGTPDNSIKDVKNLAERLARLEHYLRYELSTPKLQTDQSVPGFNYGQPMQRTGRVAFKSPEHERWDIYQRFPTDLMDKYQYKQRQDEPPRTKTFNRNIQYPLTREILSQQVLYDEKTVEGLPAIDIENEYDKAYYDRRIRRR